MKVTLMFLIICFLVMGSFLIGIGCKGQPKSVQQQPERESAQQQTLDMRDMRKSADSEVVSADSEKEPLEALEEKEPLEGYMTLAESKRWLENNQYQVQKQADGNGYIITRSSDNSRFVISNGSVTKAFMTTEKNGDSSTVEIKTVLLTTDKNGFIRVKVIGDQQ